MADSTLLLDLAHTITQAALVITKNNLASSLPAPSFDKQAGSLPRADDAELPASAATLTNGLSASKGEAQRTTNGAALSNGHKPQLQIAVDSTQVLEATSQLLQASTDLQILVSGPENYLKSLSYAYHDITALAVVVEFDLAAQVPLNSSISFRELAERTGAPLGRLERVLRLLFVRRIFYESSPGYVAHTAVSERMVTNPELTAFLGHCTHEAFPAASRLIDSMRRYSSEGPTETGFNIAFNTPDPLFSYLAKNPDRFDRFNQGMAGLSKHGGRSIGSVIEIYPWQNLGTATVVDVGGGNGHVSIALAEQYPELSFVVQDLQVAVDAGMKALPAKLKGRVSFEAHDMFSEQPGSRQGVDVFYLRHILHDWPDEYAVKILKALVPGMKSGCRVLVSDSVIPPPQHLHGLHEKFVRYLDMQMMVLHNARERTAEDFEQLFAQAHPRFKVEKVWKKGHDAAAGTMVEATFT